MRREYQSSGDEVIKTKKGPIAPAAVRFQKSELLGIFMLDRSLALLKTRSVGLSLVRIAHKVKWIVV